MHEPGCVNVESNGVVLGGFSLIGMFLVLLFACLAIANSGRMTKLDAKMLKAEFEKTTEDLAAKQEDLKRLTLEISDLMLVIIKWGFRYDGEPREMSEWKRMQIDPIIDVAEPSREEKERLLRFVRLIDTLDAGKGADETRKALEALKRAFLEEVRGKKG